MGERVLTERELAFVDAYVAGGNATQAAIDAGYTKNRNAAHVRGYRLRLRPAIQQAIVIARGELSQRTKLDAEWVERQLMYEAKTAESAGPRVRALDLLGQRLVMFTQKVEVSEKLTDEQRRLRLLALIDKGQERAKGGTS